MRKLLLWALVTLAPAVASAQALQPLHKTKGRGTATTFLAATALNTSPSFTITNTSQGYAQADLEVTRVRSAGTDFAMTCKSTIGTSAPNGVRPVCSYDASGNCEMKTATLKSSTSVSEVWSISVDILGWGRTDCTFTSTASTGSDTVAVTGDLVTK